MTLYELMGIISSVAICLPVFFILVMRLANYGTYPALLVYYVSILAYNLFTQGYLEASNELIYYWGLTNNVMDAPLMLIFLSYLYPSPEFMRKMKLVILAYVIFEVCVIGVLGYNVKAMTILLGPGILIVAGFGVYFFVRFAKRAIESMKSVGKAFIGASLVLSYGIYLLIYVMFYIVRTKEVGDVFLLYYMASVITSSLMATGVILEGKRIQKIRELQITRHELREIYKDIKIGTPRRRVPMLDFDRELLN